MIYLILIYSILIFKRIICKYFDIQLLQIGVSSSSDLTFSLQKSVLPCNNKSTALSNVSFKTNRKSYDEESYNDLNIQSKEVIRERDISNSTIRSSLSVKTNAEIQFESNSTIYLIINSFSP